MWQCYEQERQEEICYKLDRQMIDNRGGFKAQNYLEWDNDICGVFMFYTSSAFFMATSLWVCTHRHIDTHTQTHKWTLAYTYTHILTYTKLIKLRVMEK